MDIWANSSPESKWNYTWARMVRSYPEPETKPYVPSVSKSRIEAAQLTQSMRVESVIVKEPLPKDFAQNGFVDEVYVTEDRSNALKDYPAVTVGGRRLRILAVINRDWEHDCDIRHPEMLKRIRPLVRQAIENGEATPSSIPLPANVSI